MGNYFDDGTQNLYPDMMTEVDLEMRKRNWLVSLEIEKDEESCREAKDFSLDRILDKFPTEPVPTLSEESGSSLDTPPPLTFLQGRSATYQLEEMFPVRRFINLARRQDRRNDVERKFADQKLAVGRFSAVDGRFVRHTRGHGSPNVYACRLSHRLIVREAKLKKASAVLIFEDDVVLPTDFRTVAEALKPPEDWGILFFGCTHVETPEVVAPGWVKGKKIWSLHAYGVRDIYFDTVLKALNAKGEEGREEGADIVLSRLADKIPMYAVYPNIAWQGESFSDLMGKERAPFTMNGQQNRLQHVLRPTNQAMASAIDRSYGTSSFSNTPLKAEEVFPRPGRAPLWKMETIFPIRQCINLDHRKERWMLAQDQFAKIGLDVARFSARTEADGDFSSPLSAGQKGCALSHCAILNEAAENNAAAVLVFEDDVELNPHLRNWCEATPLPEDWGILYFGCQHVEQPKKVVAPGLIQAGGAYSTHAYAIRRPYFQQIAMAIRQGAMEGKPCDVVLAELQKSIPTYAFYPNLAWQSNGHSDIKQKEAESYSTLGIQRWHKASLLQVDGAMRAYFDAPDGLGSRLNNGPFELKNFWQKFDYKQSSGRLGAGLDLVVGNLQDLPLTVGSVFGHDPLPFDVVFSGECLPELAHEGRHFVYKEIHTKKYVRTRWFIGIPSILHPKALHVPLFYLQWAERLANSAFPSFDKSPKKFGVTIIAGNLKYGNLAAKRAAIAHELSKIVPVHGNRAMAAVAPPDSKMIYHDVPEKLEFVSQFTHNLCFENQSYAGYLTEKIFDAIHVGTMPLYCGDPNVDGWFEKDAYIDCTGLGAAEIAEKMHQHKGALDFLNGERQKTCKVSLEEMRQRTADFQKRIRESL